MNKLNKLNNFNNLKYKQNLQLQQTKTTTTLITNQYFDHVVARFCREIEHCSIRLQNLAPEKFHTRLYDRRARNRHVHTQPSGGHRRGETVLAATVPPVPPSKNWRILLVESSTHDLADGNQ